MAQLPVRQPDWIPTAPIVVQRTRRLPASTDAVWARIADHETWPEWFPALDRVEVTDGATGVGGGRAVTVQRRTVREEFTAWEPGRRFAFSVVEAPRLLAAMAESVELEPDGDEGCIVTYTQGIEPPRGLGWLWRAVSKRMGRELDQALDELGTAAGNG